MTYDGISDNYQIRLKQWMDFSEDKVNKTMSKHNQTRKHDGEF